ncbi:MAG: NUDIX domain-containing protein [Candidatus Omnitrophota bacterium]
MNKEFSAGAVIFKKESANIFFLIIHSNRNKIWGFPKGHLEQGETAKEAAIREIKEEVGLENLHFIDGFREEVMYETISKRPPFKGEKIEKYVTYFLCEAGNQDIIVDDREIADHRFLNFSQAEELIKFSSLKNILRRAYDFSQAL